MAHLNPGLSSAFHVLSFLQRPHLALLLAGASFVLAAPVRAADQVDAWSVGPVSAPIPQVAVLPPLPEAPRFFAMTPERKALLNTIRYAEGTWKEGHPVGYRVMFGGSYMPSLERHPNRVNYTSGYASAAAGAYQFMPFTWNLVVQTLRLNDVQPPSQDQGALFLIQRRGALPMADRGELSPELAAKLAPEWASFPTLAGNSYYGQPVKRYDELRRFYEDNLAKLRQNGVEQWETVAIRQVPRCSDESLSCRLESIGYRGKSRMPAEVQSY